MRISFARLATTAIFLLSFAASAKADPIPGWYIGAGVGANFPIDATSKVAGTNNTVQYDTGWALVGNLGYSFDNNLRAEGEMTDMRADVSHISGGSAGSTSGRINNFDVMGNLYYDFSTGTRWTPYIGGGIGLADVDADHIGPLSNGGTLNDSSVEFAYQGIAGVSYEIADHWSMSADYRYIGTTNPDFKTTAGGTASTDNTSHNVILSVRYTLHGAERPAPPPVQETAAPPPVEQPAPPPPPAPAVVPQSYMVFFDFDKSELTPEAQRILASAAQDFKKGQFVRVVVTGHTDTVGTVEYNQRLSERRAAAVRNQLVALGVNASEISAIGVGKNGLLVPTADQIREAQNRRAEIIFSKPE